MNYDIELEKREIPKYPLPNKLGKHYSKDKEHDIWVFCDKMPNTEYGQEVAQFVITNNYGEVLGKEKFTQSEFGNFPMWAKIYGRTGTVISQNILEDPSLILHLPVKFFGRNGGPNLRMYEDLLTTIYMNKMVSEENGVKRGELQTEYFNKLSKLRAVCALYPTQNVDMLAGGGKSGTGTQQQPE